MILGVGIDLQEINGFRRSLRRFGLGYLEETFTDDELGRSPCIGEPAVFYARAFCAKEACAKALGTGIDGEVDWYDIAVVQAATSASITLTHGALARARTLTPPGLALSIRLSLGNTSDVAHATVILEALPRTGHPS